jgi:hypothetical protein
VVFSPRARAPLVANSRHIGISEISSRQLPEPELGFVWAAIRHQLFTCLFINR